MKNLKSHLRFTKQEQRGIFYLLCIIVSLQTAYFFYAYAASDVSTESFVVDESIQAEIDSLKNKALEKDSVKLYPFNPNFITDYKGYVLGMSPSELDRLYVFRTTDSYVNSAKEFQEVTGVSDSLLRNMMPYFKFPKWKKWSKDSKRPSNPSKNEYEKNKNGTFVVKDLNAVTTEELRVINGIGEKLSARIIKFRDRLGGFLVNEQLYDVYGLDEEVVRRTLEIFQVIEIPEIKKININTASAEQLSELVYLQKTVAERIVTYRSLNGNIDSFEELSKIDDFPVDRIDRIILYLSLKK